MTIKVILLTVVGFLCLGLGAVGLLVPILPTTPFVLVAAGCFTATPRLRARILRIGFFREYIENYQQHKGLSRKTVVFSLAFLWGMLLLSMAMIQTLWLVLLLLCIGAAVTVHIVMIARKRKTKEDEE